MATSSRATAGSTVPSIAQITTTPRTGHFHQARLRLGARPPRPPTLAKRARLDTLRDAKQTTAIISIMIRLIPTAEPYRGGKVDWMYCTMDTDMIGMLAGSAMAWGTANMPNPLQTTS